MNYTVNTYIHIYSEEQETSKCVVFILTKVNDVLLYRSSTFGPAAGGASSGVASGVVGGVVAGVAAGVAGINAIGPAGSYTPAGTPPHTQTHSKREQHHHANNAALKKKVTNITYKTYMWKTITNYHIHKSVHKTAPVDLSNLHCA